MSDHPEHKNDPIEKIRQYLEKKLSLNESDDQGAQSPRKRNQVLTTLDMEGLIQHWKSGGFKRIVTMVGAGISTSAGIPDFRSPGTGLYDNLRKYKLPYPTAIFELDYFMRKPKPFFALAKELYPGNFRPTDCHYFIRLLHEKGLLQRHYTQNIDTLERVAGIPDEMLVEAHGTFHTNHCVKCKKEHTMAWMKDVIFRDELPKCTRCGSLVKPDIVFFGENLPEKFYTMPDRDFRTCDLLIVMGTSLEVQPFAGLINMVGPKCVRLLINLEEVGRSRHRGEGFLFGSDKNERDVMWLGTCESAIRHLAEMLDYTADLDKLIASEQGPKNESSSVHVAKSDSSSVQAAQSESSSDLEKPPKDDTTEEKCIDSAKESSSTAGIDDTIKKVE